MVGVADKSWLGVLESHRYLDKPWLILTSAAHRSDEHRVLSYKTLYEIAVRCSSTLRRLGTRPIVVLPDNSPESCICLIGALLAGIPVVPCAPSSLGRPSGAWTENLRHVIGSCGAGLVLCADVEASGLRTSSPCSVKSFAELLAGEPLTRDTPAVSPSDDAIYQYTSGTTGQARAVVLSHGNVMSNIAAIGERVNAGPRDVGASWLPLFHDMGLIGSLLFSTYWGMSLVLMTPRMFVAHPEAWLWAISRFGVTFSAAPNSAYEMCVAKLSDAKLQGLQLSSWRLAFNGAELVHGTTVERFCTRFEAYGFRRTSMYPVYGLAEHTVAATMPARPTGPVLDWVDAATLARDAVARNVPPHSAGARAVVSVGTPFANHDLRIVHDGLPDNEERRVGDIELAGPSKMGRYLSSDAATSSAVQRWLKTGDRGYFADGRVFITGRASEVIEKGRTTVRCVLRCWRRWLGRGCAGRDHRRVRNSRCREWHRTPDPGR